MKLRHGDTDSAGHFGPLPRVEETFHTSPLLAAVHPGVVAAESSPRTTSAPTRRARSAHLQKISDPGLRVSHVEENAAAADLRLTDADIAGIETACPRGTKAAAHDLNRRSTDNLTPFRADSA